MRKNTGLAYKRRRRNAKIQREKAQMLARDKRVYAWSPEVDLSFDAYAASDPDMLEYVRRAGVFAKRSFHCGACSTRSLARFWWSYYSRTDIRKACRALWDYDEYGIPNGAANRSKAQRIAHNADRKAAKHRKIG